MLQVLVTTVLILPLIAVWLMLTAAYATRFLRRAYVPVVADRSFVLARRRGPAAALRGFVARPPGRSVPAHLARLVAGLLSLGLVLSAGYLVGALLPGALVLALPLDAGLLPRALADAVTVFGTTGAIVTLLVWLRGLGYVARPHLRRFGLLPRLDFPSGTPVEGRLRIALNAYLHSQIGLLAVLAFCYPWLLLAFAGTNLPEPSADEPSPPPGLEASPLVVGIGYVALLVLPTLLAVRLTARAVRRRQAVSATAAAIAAVLAARPPAPTELADRLVDDPPLDARRQRLTAIADGLTEMARRLDARQPRGFTPHPTATLLRGSAAAVHAHLISNRALTGGLPPELIRILTLTFALLTGAARPAHVAELAGAVSAFDEQGAPAVELAVRPPGRVAALLARATTGVERAVLLLGGLATIVGLLLAVALTAAGDSDGNTLVGHLLR